MSTCKKCFSVSLVVLFLLSTVLTANVFAKEFVIGFSGPLSGPGAGYGRDNLNGLEMACKDLNKAGGLMIDGTKYTCKIKAYDDMIDPTAAVNNARRLRSRDGARVIFNPVFNTIAPMMEINQMRGSDFLMMAYSSTPKIDELGNDLAISIPPPFTAYVHAFSKLAWEKGWRKCAMVVTLGAYGDEWREAFKHYWVNTMKGEIVADKPANYYTDTDFSSQLSAALAENPDFMLIGGPSETTGLVIEQARNLGFKGGFILVDQAKMDYVADVIFKGDLTLMDKVIGIAACRSVPSEVVEHFTTRYEKEYGVHITFEAMLEYSILNAVFDAMKAAGTVDDPRAIKAAFPKVLPQDPAKIPTVYMGIQKSRMLISGTVGYISNKKYSETYQYVWWLKNKSDYDKIKSMIPSNASTITRWAPLDGYAQ